MLYKAQYIWYLKDLKDIIFIFGNYVTKFSMIACRKTSGNLTNRQNSYVLARICEGRIHCTEHSLIQCLFLLMSHSLQVDSHQSTPPNFQNVYTEVSTLGSEGNLNTITYKML